MRAWVGFVLFIVFTQISVYADEIDIRGSISLESRFYPASPRFESQDDYHIAPSLILEPELSYDWSDSRIIFQPFLVLDSYDANRSHFDVRELSYLLLGDSFTLTAGIGKVFWGVTESRHLVDIVNQDDFVQDIDREDKLGQPMVNLTLEGEYGAFDFFYLPYFREQTFPEDDARLRGPFPIDDDAEYESSAEQWHPDSAVRWSHSISDFDVGVSYFYGTSREPRFVFSSNDSSPQFVPYYDIINQTGLDLQWTRDAWLLKLEAITRGGQGDRFFASVAGFEYTLFQIFDSSTDLGLLMEYLHDGRDSDAPTTLFDNDLFSGARLALNDTQDTEVLGGVVVDMSDGEVFSLLEASRRIGDDLLVEFEMRYILGAKRDSLAYGLERDSFFLLRLSHYL